MARALEESPILDAEVNKENKIVRMGIFKPEVKSSINDNLSKSTLVIARGAIEIAK